MLSTLIYISFADMCFFLCLLHLVTFNNYVDKMWGGGGPKMSVFVLAQGIKTVHARGGGGQKKAKFCPRSC